MIHHWLHRFTQRHGRFLIAFPLGLLVGFISRYWSLPFEARALLAANTFFITYLWLITRMALSPAALRKRADGDDEGAQMIVVIAAFTFLIALTAILRLINDPKQGGLFETGLALAAVPLGWLLIHTLAAFHYAHEYYQRKADASAAPGLIFPDCEEPSVTEFIYFSFCIGMAAQVSDVVVNSTPMRRLVMIHAMASFFTNTVILALTVNAAASL